MSTALRAYMRLFMLTCAALVCGQTGLALDQSLDISQYAHTAWTVRDGFSLGNIYAIAQTPDGYLWLGSEFGLFRFDGLRSVLWQPPTGEHLPDHSINALLVTRDGTLWIGTFAGAVAWNGTKLTRYPELDGQVITSFYEDREGTIWVGTLANSGLLCAIRNGSTQCYGKDGVFGRATWALYEDNSGTLWAAAQSGLWRMKPGPPKRYPTSTEIIALSKGENGGLFAAMHGAGLLQFTGDKLESYPIRRATDTTALFRDHEVDSNRLLRDRDGGLWIGTIDRGLIHVHHGRADVFAKSDGLSGDVILSMLEDREGNIWVASTGGLDRFRELPVATISMKQGLSSDATQSVLATTDETIWVASHGGLTRWQNGQARIFSKAHGLPDDAQSLFEDGRKRVWVSMPRGVVYFQDGRFVPVNAASGEVFGIAGDSAGNVWLSERESLFHLMDGRVVEQIHWPEFGHPQNASVLLTGPEPGGLWMGFWSGGGVAYLKDHQLRASFTTAEGLGAGPVSDLHLDADGALWASTEEGGLSRIKDGHIITLTTKNGLPCDAIHWTRQDDDRAFWMYTGCGVVRVARGELDAWIADPKRRIASSLWDAADGVRLRRAAASAYGPRVAKSTDGKLWFVTGEGVQVVDPHHLVFNELPPPVRIERIIADHKVSWQNLPGAAASNLRLPARVRDLEIDYTALTLVAPEKVHFKYMLEGQDEDWKEVVNDRQVQYTNLRPRGYRFRVIASNNSGVWNEQGDVLEFSIDPAFYQTNWFRALCVAAVLALFWAMYQLRIRQLHHEFGMTLDARVGERTRIARELHDTLLQSFHGILLHLQTISNELPSGRTKQKLDSAIDQAAQAIVEGRDAVQGLRSSAVEGNDLALAIRTLGEELSGKADGSRRPQFSVQVEGTPRNLHPIVRDEVYRIAGEALRNAFRHSEAQHIEAEIRYDDRELRVRVRDGGKGIDPQHLSDEERGGHFGLPGMRERAKLAGGKLTVWSELGAGTEVELSIPAARAYMAPTDRKATWIAENLLAKLSGRGAVKKR